MRLGRRTEARVDPTRASGYASSCVCVYMRAGGRLLVCDRGVGGGRLCV